MSKPKLITYPANIGRGLMGLLALTLIAIGAGLLWGIGGSFLAIGLTVFANASTDEALERLTGKERK
jgi:predicted PurR-regulated permease PerM